MVIKRKINDRVFFFAAAIALVALDQLAKAAARHFIPPSANIHLLGPLGLVRWANTGSVFGIFQGTSGYIALLSLVVFSSVIVLYLRGFIKQRLAAIVLVAGLAGNTIDRLSMGFVTDFIYVRPWPAFNLADAFLTTGIVLFAASIVLPHVFRKRK